MCTLWIRYMDIHGGSRQYNTSRRYTAIFVSANEISCRERGLPTVGLPKIIARDRILNLPRLILNKRHVTVRVKRQAPRHGPIFLKGARRHAAAISRYKAIFESLSFLDTAARGCANRGERAAGWTVIGRSSNSRVFKIKEARHVPL